MRYYVQVEYAGNDEEMTNIVLVHDHQCAPYVASGSVFSPGMVRMPCRTGQWCACHAGQGRGAAYFRMLCDGSHQVDYLMFQTYYSCYTLGIVAHMATGQLLLVPVPSQLWGHTFLDLVLVLTSGPADSFMLPIALMRPAGHNSAKLRYLYTMPKADVILVKGDRMYVLQKSAITANFVSPRSPNTDPDHTVEEINENRA